MDEIEKEKEIIEKEKVIDRERKEQLDIQEAFNKKEKIRLSTIASKFS